MLRTDRHKSHPLSLAHPCCFPPIPPLHLLLPLPLPLPLLSLLYFLSSLLSPFTNPLLLLLLLTPHCCCRHRHHSGRLLLITASFAAKLPSPASYPSSTLFHRALEAREICAPPPIFHSTPATLLTNPDAHLLLRT